jgi:DNA polymerase alpha-associated DNA helicase A
MSTSTTLSYTIFDRLIDMYGDTIKKMLCIQYRMHKKIMEFSSHELYEKKLVAHSTNSVHLLRHLKFVVKKSPNTTVPILLFDTSDTGESQESKSTDVANRSTYNILEAQIAIYHVEQLIKDGLTENQIGIITPYAAQVRKIQLMMGEKWQDIEVGSVDGFQGREKEAIILTLVRSNNRNDVGFLSEKRRLNGKSTAHLFILFRYLINLLITVAMTRARRHLAVICDTGAMINTTSARRNPSLTLDRQFLAKWMTWLLKNSVVKYSKELNLVTAQA